MARYGFRPAETQNRESLIVSRESMAFKATYTSIDDLRLTIHSEPAAGLKQSAYYCRFAGKLSNSGALGSRKSRVKPQINADISQIKSFSVNSRPWMQKPI